MLSYIIFENLFGTLKCVPHLSEQMNSLLSPLPVTCEEVGEGTVRAGKLHLAIENNKLHFERVNLYLMVFLFSYYTEGMP